MIPFYVIYSFVYLGEVLGIKPKASHMLGSIHHWDISPALLSSFELFKKWNDILVSWRFKKENLGLGQQQVFDQGGAM